MGPVGSLRAQLVRLAPVLGLGGMAALVLAGLVTVLAPGIGRAANVLVGAAVALLSLYVIAAFSDVRAGMLARQTRYGANTFIMAVAFLAILAILNVLGSQARLRTDITAGGQYTLSRQTISVLKGLAEPVKVTGFFPKLPEAQAAQEEAANRLTEYRFQTDKISFEFIDPDEKPGIARQYEVNTYGAVVFEAGTKRKQVFGLSEQDFTGAILNVTGKEQPKLYFVEGHGERSVDATDNPSFGHVRRGLIADNYLVDTLNLSTVQAVPQDAALVVVAGPRRPFLNAEVEILERHLTGGGKALFMVEPQTPAEVRSILAKWGVEVLEGVIVDNHSFVRPDVTVPLAGSAQYTFSQITKDLPNSFFPGAAALRPRVPEDDRDHITVSPLAVTSPQSFLETDAQRVEFTPGTDPTGPFLLALTVEANQPIGRRPVRAPAPVPGQPIPVASPEQNPTRLVVFADSDFASNAFFFSLGNSDLFLNAVNWLTAQEGLISIRPKPPEFRRLDVTRRTWDFILYSAAALWPLAVLATGGVVWWRRR